MSNGNEPAFPMRYLDDRQDGRRVHVSADGLTKREYFAASNLQGMIACANTWPSRSDFKEMAERSVWCAEEMPRLHKALRYPPAPQQEGERG